MTSRLKDAVRRLERLGVALDELADVYAARRESDRDPLEAYFSGETAPCFDSAPLAAHPLAVTRQRSRAANLGRRTLRAARAGALPLLLAGALSLFGLVRLQPANTLWSQQLTLTANLETGEFSCDPLKLAFDPVTGFSHPNGTTTKLTYTLSGGGTNGPNCQTKDISHLSIDVCFNPEIGGGNPILSETHPGSGTSAWKYSPKNSSTPKLVKWESQTSSAPFGGKGPFDPAQMVFTITVNDYLALPDLVDGMSRFKASTVVTDSGLVKVPGCNVAAPLAAPAAFGEPEAPAPAEEPEPELPQPIEIPDEPKKPEKPGPASIGSAGSTEPKPRPTPTPKPAGVFAPAPKP